MQISFTEQDIYNAMCVATGAKLDVAPQFVDATLHFDDVRGFSGRGEVGFRVVKFHDQQELVDAIAFYLLQYHNFEPANLQIELAYNANNNEFSANIITV